MAEWFLIIWLVLGLLILAGMSFSQGYRKLPSWQREEELNDILPVAFGWPLIIVFFIGYGIFILPFLACRKLGEFVGNRIRQ